MDRPRPQVYVALVVAALMWGTMPVAGKALIGTVGPAQQALVRGVAAFIVLSGFCLAVAGTSPLRAALARPLDVFVLGALSFYGSSLTSLASLLYISASLNALIIATSPVFLALLAFATGGMGLRAVLGAVVALAGVAVVIAGDDPARVLAGGISPIGVAIALLTALIIAGSQLWGRRLATRVDPTGSTAIAAGMVVPFLAATTFAQGGVDDIVHATPETALLLIYLGVFCTAVNFGLWYWALKYVTAARAAPIQYISPPASVLLAWFFLDEPLTLSLAVGTALVIGGVALSQLRRPSPRQRPTA